MTGSTRVVPAALWRLFAVVWLAFLAFPVRDVLLPNPTPVRLIPALAGTAILITCYLWLMLRDPFPAATPLPAALRRRLLLLTILALVVVGLTLGSGSDWLWFFMFAGLPVGVLLPPRIAVPTIAALVLVEIVVGAMAVGWLLAGRVALPVAAVGLGMIGVARLVATVRDLRAARAELARLAVADERLRFARDLHDLLGHSLSAITLKLELARRLMAQDPMDAEREIAETIATARAALGEVALAWTVREGVTNVVRHGHAHHCVIRLIREASTVVAEVIDDGTGGMDAVNTAGSGGHGLRGLAERAGPLGGRVEAGPVDGGFRLRVVLPLDGRPDCNGIAG